MKTLKEKVFSILVEDSFALNRKTISETDVERLVNILLTDGVIFRNGDQLKVTDSYSVNLSNQTLLVKGEEFSDWDEVCKHGLVKAIEDLVETTNNVDTISAMTHIPPSRFHGGLKEITFEYEEILSIIYEAMSPFRAYIDNVDDVEEDVFKNLYESREVVKDAVHFLKDVL